MNLEPEDISLSGGHLVEPSGFKLFHRVGVEQAELHPANTSVMFSFLGASRELFEWLPEGITIPVI